MAQGDKKIGSLSYKQGETNYNVLSIWESAQYPGTYSISRDKDRDQYRAISLFDALKGFVAGTGYLTFRMPRPSNDRGGQRRQETQRGPAQGNRKPPEDEWLDEDIF